MRLNLWLIRQRALGLVALLSMLWACSAHQVTPTQLPVDSNLSVNKAVATEYIEALGTAAFDAVANTLQEPEHRLIRHEFENLKYNADDPVLKTLSDPLHVAIAERRNSVTRIMAQGHLVALTYRANGVHAGNLFGIPATNKPVELEGAAVLTLNDGKLVESWFLIEEAGFLVQVGARLPRRTDGQLNLPPVIDNTRTYDEALAEHLANPRDTPEWWHTRLLLSYKSQPENRPADYQFNGRPYSNLQRGGIDVIKNRGEALGIQGGHGQSMSGRRDMISEVVAEGDFAMMRFRLTARNTGPLYGIPASGGALNDWEVGFGRFDGRDWVDAWWMKDELGFLLSIGNRLAVDFLVRDD